MTEGGVPPRKWRDMRLDPQALRRWIKAFLSDLEQASPSYGQQRTKNSSDCDATAAAYDRSATSKKSAWH